MVEKINPSLRDTTRGVMKDVAESPPTVRGLPRDSTARFSRMTVMEPLARDFAVVHPTVSETTGDFSIVRVRSRHERVFVRELRAEDIGYYLPLRLHKRYRRGRKLESHVPMFSGLVFVANGADGRSVAANSRCVHGFMHVAPSYQPQLRRELTTLELILAHDPEVDAYPELIQGREVQVRPGHWAEGLRGVIDSREKRNTFCVRLETMGRMVPVSNIPAELLEVIDAAA
jgi:transcription antitermination factor NusG